MPYRRPPPCVQSKSRRPRPAAPCPPTLDCRRRSRRARSLFTGGLRPAGPPARSLAGTPYPAPFAWLTRSTRSRRRQVVTTSLSSLFTGGLRPAGPPCTLTRGDPVPRSVRAARSRRSLALLHLHNRPFVDGSARPSCLSVSTPGDFAPPDPPARSLAGAPGPAPFAWLARCARSRRRILTRDLSLTEGPARVACPSSTRRAERARTP